MIHFELVLITPEKAKQWLDHNNEGNRSIKPTIVNKYARDIREGNWRLTHQCIAFDSTGHLIDGQHRLSAVVQSDMPIHAYVAQYDSAESAMKLPIDMQAKRAIFEVLQVSRREQETAAAALRVMKTNATLPTMTEIESVIRIAKDIMTVVHGCISGTVKYRSAAPARAAIMMLMKEYPSRAEYLAKIYREFVSMDLADLPSSVLALVKNLDGGQIKVGGSDQRELFLRVYYAFSPPNFGVKIIRLSDPEGLTRHVRETGRWILGE